MICAFIDKTLVYCVDIILEKYTNPCYNSIYAYILYSIRVILFHMSLCVTAEVVNVLFLVTINVMKLAIKYACEPLCVMIV